MRGTALRIYDVDFFKETTIKHRILLYILNSESHPVKSRPSYCTSFCTSNDRTVSLLNNEFSLNETKPLHVQGRRIARKSGPAKLIDSIQLVRPNCTAP